MQHKTSETWKENFKKKKNNIVYNMKIVTLMEGGIVAVLFY